MRLFALGLLIASPIPAQVSATVAINTSQTTPLNPNFSGFNDEVPFPPEFYDYRQNVIAAGLSPGWVRYPSGLFSDAFDWQTGMMVPSWVSQFSTTNIYTLLSNSIPWVNGKGGGSFVDGANRADFLGAKLIIDVNAYTDTPASIGQMAAFAKASHIPVAVWELANEPYLYSNFFAGATDYLNAVKPFRDAIKAADPSAVVAVFLNDPGHPRNPPGWNQDVASYPNPFWDALTYHHYPAQSTGAFSRWMADENAVLASGTNDYVTGTLEPMFPAGTKFLISEFLPSDDQLGSDTSLTDGTLYGAIYAAEFVMRMSTVPSMLYVGMHAMTGQRGVYAATPDYEEVTAAFNAGTTLDTLSLDFGFFTVTQPQGLAVLNSVMKNATLVDATTVTGGSTVTATGLSPVPALYAQAYSGATGKLSVVITNKSATANQAAITVNGAPVSGTLPLTFIAGTDPTVENTASSQNNVVIQTGASANPVTIPAYSVVRVDLNNPAVASVVSSASFAPGPVAANEIVALFGPNVASETATASLPLPISLAGTSVQITDSTGNSQFAPLFVVASGQANILIPPGLATGPATLKVLQGSGGLAGELNTTALTGTLNIANSAPALYSMNSDGAGVAAAIGLLIDNTTGAQTVVPVFACNPPAQRSCLPVPLSVGDSAQALYVELYGTGIRNAASVLCYIDGQLAPVQFFGATSDAGLDQVNIEIPQALAGSGDVRLYLVVDGAATNVVGLNLM